MSRKEDCRAMRFPTTPPISPPDGLPEPPYTRLVETPSACRKRPKRRSRPCRPHSIRRPMRPALLRPSHAHETVAAHSAIGPAVRVPKSRPHCRPTDRRRPGSMGPFSAVTMVPRSTKQRSSPAPGGMSPTTNFPAAGARRAKGPAFGRGAGSINGKPRLWATPRLAESMSARVISADKRKSPKYRWHSVSGESRIERHADCTGCDPDHRHRRLWSVRQYHRYPVAWTHTKAPQPAHRIVCPGPELTIGYGGAAGRQDGIAVGGDLPIVGKQILKAQKGSTSSLLACRPLW